MAISWWGSVNFCRAAGGGGIPGRAGRSHMKTSDRSGSFPSPLRGGWLAQILHLGQSGGGKPKREPRSEHPPPRPPLPDDATHRLRSHSRCGASAFRLETAAEGRLCPPRKGEGSQLRHVSYHEG